MTAKFWQYDSRLGKRWNLDPVPQISISDYAVFANNPIYFNDPLGDIFDVANEQSKKDVTNMVDEKNRKFLSFTQLDDGKFRVDLDFGEMSKEEKEKLLESDKGLSLINDLVNAEYEKEDGTKEDAYFLYKVSYTYKYKNRKTGIVKEKKFDIGEPGTNNLRVLSVLSITPRNNDGGVGLEGLAPGDEGYHSVFTIAPGRYVNKDNFLKLALPHAGLLFHELA